MAPVFTVRSGRKLIVIGEIHYVELIFLAVFNFTHPLAHSFSHERNLKLNMRSLYGNFVIKYKTSLIVFDSYYCYAKWYSSIVKREYE